MIATSISLHVVTPERQLLQESVDSLQLPGQKGYLGILPGHAALITELGYGELSYRKGKDLRHLTVMGGYAEVLADRVIVLAEVSERAEEINVDRARAAKERAEKLMGKPGDKDVDWDVAMLALRRALIRLQVAAKGGAVAAAEDHHTAP
ncbi:MAG: F0F1 ATP synthase subunit epsilon [Acidobacteria bacterium]|nr:F0F1 ATP synthase subunit epsilon [Acidobacteriota bacterium]MBI3662105.1 F0F1 ATP synthase subunit epsilon [Acidobacteriota bacterium]